MLSEDNSMRGGQQQDRVVRAQCLRAGGEQSDQGCREPSRCGQEVAAPIAVTRIPPPAPLPCAARRAAPDPLICISFVPSRRPLSGSWLGVDICVHNLHYISIAQISFPRFSCSKTGFKNESPSSALSSLVNSVPYLICSGDLLSLARGRLPPASYIGISAPSSVTLCAAQSPAGFLCQETLDWREPQSSSVHTAPPLPRAGIPSPHPAQGHVAPAGRGPPRTGCSCPAGQPRCFRKGGPTWDLSPFVPQCPVCVSECSLPQEQGACLHSVSRATWCLCTSHV